MALSIGDVAYVDEPLYDYIQHGKAVLGHDEANAGSRGRPLTQRLDPRRFRQTVNGWASAYFDVYLRLQALAKALPGPLRRTVWRRARAGSSKRFIATNRDPLGPLWLWLRSLRTLVGRNETLGVERVLARAVLYRHLAAARNRIPDSVLERAGAGAGRTTASRPESAKPTE